MRFWRSAWTIPAPAPRLKSDWANPVGGPSASVLAHRPRGTSGVGRHFSPVEGEEPSPCPSALTGPPTGSGNAGSVGLPPALVPTLAIGRGALEWGEFFRASPQGPTCPCSWPHRAARQ